MPDPVLRRCFTFETGGVEELYAGTPGVQNRAAGPGSPRPDEEYTAVFTWKVGAVTQPYACGTSDWITVHAYVRFMNDDPQATSAFLRARNLVPNECWYLQWTTTANSVEFFDSNGVSQGTTGGWKEDTWYHVVVKFKWVGSSDVLVVRHELRDNGDVVRSDVLWSLTGVDCLPAGAVNLVVRFRNDVDPSGPGGAADSYCNSAYVESDSGASITTVNTWDYDLTALCYQNTTQSISVDFGFDGLEVGWPWSDAANLPGNDATSAWYVNPGAGQTKEGGCYMNDGTRTGPNGDSRLPAAGTFHGAIYVWRADATNNDCKFYGQYGSSGDASGETGQTTITPGNPENFVQHIDASSGLMPATNEYMAQGMKAQSIRAAAGIKLHEQWAILVVRRRVRRLPDIIRSLGIVPAA